MTSRVLPERAEVSAGLAMVYRVPFLSCKVTLRLVSPEVTVIKRFAWREGTSNFHDGLN